MAEAYPEFDTKPGEKPIAYVLIGLPGSGKSLWARGHPQKLPIASTDAYIENYAAQNGLDYAQSFKACYSEACADLKNQINHFTKKPVPFIWDQVNLAPEERLKIHERLDATHRVVYVIFRVPLDECLRRHRAREREGGAVVDEERIRMLAKSAVFPLPGHEPFYKLITLTHPGWGREG